jgi:hypothetical protein
VPGELDFVCSTELGQEAVDVLGVLLPVYERIAGTVPELPGD